MSLLQHQDKFYAELPFTISPQQSKPSYLILGTGLQECLLAAHLSKIHRQQTLILDIDRTYGSCLKTVTLKQLHSLAMLQEHQKLYTFFKMKQSLFTMNQQYYQNCMTNKMFRGYNIDVEPNFFYGCSLACQMLREADMDKYMDFRLVSRMTYLTNNQFKNVPLSKGKIFQAKDLSMMEKKVLLGSFHSLAQVYHRFNNIEQDQNSTKQFDKDFGQVDQKLYAQFMKNKDEIFYSFINEKIVKKNKKIMDYMVYIICNYQYNYNNLQKLPAFIQAEYTLGKFVKRFGKFLKSCGIYGQGPYLYVDNGIGDVPQSYSRIASIFGATYILHPKITIDKIQQDTVNRKVKVYTNLYPQGFIEADQLFIGPTFYEYYQKNKQSQQSIEQTIQQGIQEHTHQMKKISYNIQHILRVLILCEKNQNQSQQQQYPSISYLLDLDKQRFENPVYLFMFDQTSHSCPKNLLLYQFETLLNAEQISNQVMSKLDITQKYQKNIHQKVQNLIETISAIEDNKKDSIKFRDRLKYVTAYVREKRYPNQIVKTDNDHHLHHQKKSENSNENYTPQLQLQRLLVDHNGIDLDSHFINFKDVVGTQPTYFRLQNQNNNGQMNQNEQINEQGQDYETIDLVNRLHQINFSQQDHKKVNNEQLKQEITAQIDINTAQKSTQKQIKQNQINNFDQIHENIDNLQLIQQDVNKIEQNVDKAEQDMDKAEQNVDIMEQQQPQIQLPIPQQLNDQ